MKILKCLFLKKKIQTKKSQSKISKKKQKLFKYKLIKNLPFFSEFLLGRRFSSKNDNLDFCKFRLFSDFS